MERILCDRFRAVGNGNAFQCFAFEKHAKAEICDTLRNVDRRKARTIPEHIWAKIRCPGRQPDIRQAAAIAERAPIKRSQALRELDALKFGAHMKRAASYPRNSLRNHNVLQTNTSGECTVRYPTDLCRNGSARQLFAIRKYGYAQLCEPVRQHYGNKARVPECARPDTGQPIQRDLCQRIAVLERAPIDGDYAVRQDDAHERRRTHESAKRYVRNPLPDDYLANFRQMAVPFGLLLHLSAAREHQHAAVVELPNDLITL